MFKNKIYVLKFLFTAIFILVVNVLSAQTIIKGNVRDSKTKETIPGVTISIKGTTLGAISDENGNYQLNVSPGKYTVITSYIAYQPMEITDVVVEKDKPAILDIPMTEAAQNLNDVIVVARKNMESEMNLMMERRRATVAVENLGAREMSNKGLSTVADGIKKITGISMEGNTKVFVRGLGDRYSMTSLNGFPIASPNPDNKLIPLTLFPTSVVKNVTVSKVYQPSVFGDYSGAHIDVETKENIGNNYITVGVSTGGKTNTLFKDFYSSDKGGVGIPFFGISKGFNQSGNIKDLTPGEFSTYILNNNPFETTFNISKNKGLPELGLEFGIGHSWNVGGQKLNAMLGINFDNSYTIYDDAYVSTVNAQGVVRDMFNYNKYSYETTATAIGQLSYTLRKNDIISLNAMYVNNSEDNYSIRDGYDAEGVAIKNSNSVYHLYTLLNSQLTGKHQFSNIYTDWQVSYGRTTSDEPDRRQVVYTKNDDGKYSLFKLNQQGTMRYFGELFEDEWNGDLKLKYVLNDAKENKDFVRLGGSLRKKTRDFNSTNYYYNIDNIDINVNDIFSTDNYLNYNNIANGIISIEKNAPKRNKYFAGSDIYAVFVDAEYYPVDKLLVAAGVRYEHSEQWVRYWDDKGQEKLAELNSDDFFPAVNLRYSLNDKQNLRLSFSRTITRPSFIEMAPFEYKESYGGASVRGNENIENGYNYNFDLRYEIFPASGDMFSLSAYYKHLKTPIERIQKYSGSAMQSFDNVDKGTVAGAELEVRKYLIKDVRVDFNASYIYTHISLPEDGIYTDKKRELQGASPYLFNLDINYSPKFTKEREASFSIVYNLRGPRISSVGINGVNNVIEESFNSLDFVAGYSFNPRMKLKLQAKNLINQKQKFTQEISETGKDEVVEYYKKGLSLGIGFSMNF
ncbi:outer membrane receptor protein involved in Fe transport [Dysgonomonas hofstadii]|uniref:Outer membrane receptor protein involved in Fe transport n=1 Tax=Dysgonomonas hofstadii TaxID=637886 RepID=A0A840CJ88_9BACT|nr:TonB-dependent receptor [Dysgonomonas hofstadii]MBB4035231.1 outer membrane receptor protein involved in Fe transport [Dysgonomonas hofstadii]